jgi:dTDP-4-amino-4,6-dideoxygalactose transaminase
MSVSEGIKFGRFDGEDVYTTNDSDRLVRLPMWYGMSDEEVEKVIEGVKKNF